MTEIRNTTAAMRDDPAEPLLILAEAMGIGSAESFIVGQERAGQRELVNSDRLPTDVRDRAELEALGFTFGDPDPDDPLFCPATLPEGWKREASDHDMWSYITDQHGRKRVAIFYKAAFYDRRAFMRLESLDWYVTQFVEYPEETGASSLVITDEWATPETVKAAMERLRDEAKAEAARFRDYAGEDNRSEDNKARVREIATEKDAVAAKYDAHLAEMFGE